MHWYCRAYDDDGNWIAYCVWATTEYRASVKLGHHIFNVEGYTASSIECEMWNTFEHGDFSDYKILS